MPRTKTKPKPKPKPKSVTQAAFRLRALLVVYYEELGSYAEVERLLGVHRSLVRYWVRKVGV
jgi:transposase-like protein